LETFLFWYFDGKQSKHCFLGKEILQRSI